MSDVDTRIVTQSLNLGSSAHTGSSFRSAPLKHYGGKVGSVRFKSGELSDSSRWFNDLESNDRLTRARAKGSECVERSTTTLVVVVGGWVYLPAGPLGHASSCSAFWAGRARCELRPPGDGLYREGPPLTPSAFPSNAY